MRVARVEHQVDQHLLQLAPVGPDLPGVGREPELEERVFAQGAAQHLLHLADDGVDLSTWGRRNCCRVKARSCRVTSAARVPALMTSSTSARRGSSGSRLRSRNSLKPMTPVIMLFTSWATPPASFPAACIRSARRRCSSTRFRSVTSR